MKVHALSYIRLKRLVQETVTDSTATVTIEISLPNVTCIKELSCILHGLALCDLLITNAVKFFMGDSEDVFVAQAQ